MADQSKAIASRSISFFTIPANMFMNRHGAEVATIFHPTSISLPLCFSSLSTSGVTALPVNFIVVKAIHDDPAGQHIG